eukprot:TRINITY_DN10518_c0_g1_i2.p1 TRINITY_DN10518_c0_g1~~TRINITY_DN10518_c0_g1_i2.p1  ORF type:complete len:305 (+),score=26.88 TRINITY_DN10518_c0_g1_i2:251-1165(+)
MKRVRGHPNVVNLLTSYSRGGMGIVMPFYGEADLFKYVWQRDGLPEIEAAGVTRDLLSALHHVHGCGIVHRDVKPENMILDQDGKAVLLDFDVACYIADTAATSARRGSPGYMAPEVLEGNPCCFSSDVFSAGCVVYFMIAKVHPFVKKKEVSTDEILECNKLCELTFTRRFNAVSRECRQFVSSIVVKHPGCRLPLHLASSHAWLGAQEQRPEDDRAGGSSDDVLPGEFGRTSSLMVHCERFTKPSPGSRFSKAKMVGRNMVCQMSRAFPKMRRKSSTVSPLQDQHDGPTEGASSMTGILIRD